MSSAILGGVNNGLPDELVVLVVDHLAGDNKTLCALAQTCRTLQYLAEEHIYKIIELFAVSDLYAIVEAFASRIERARSVQVLKLQYHYDVKDLEDHMDIRRGFNNCLSHMVNLREWHIESPYDNSGHWELGEGPRQWVLDDMAVFRMTLHIACTEGPREQARIQAESRLGNQIERNIGLARLEKLTIHSHGVHSEFWDLEHFHCMFRHPSLQYLHVSCVSFREDITALELHVRKTPLRTLIFDECEITPSSLRAILQTPAKLKHLTLGENVWNTSRSRRINPILTKNANATLESLEWVAHSLESLTHFDPGCRREDIVFSKSQPRMPVLGEGLRNFHNLKHIQCEMGSFLHRAIIMNHEVAPPNLETLRLASNMRAEYTYFSYLPEIETYLALPSLSSLQLMQATDFWRDQMLADYISAPSRLRARHAYAYKLYKAGINLELFVEMHRTIYTIPPYLAGEALPQVRCLYDAKEIGFHRYIDDQDDSTHDREADSSERSAPETDQLSDKDVKSVNSNVQYQLSLLKQHFEKVEASESEDEDDDDDGDESEESDGSEEIDFEDEFDLDDMDMDIDMDDDGISVAFDEDGNMYFGMYQSESEDEVFEDAVMGQAGNDEALP